MRDADQRHRLPQPDRLALDVALDFGRARWIWNMQFVVVGFPCQYSTVLVSSLMLESEPSTISGSNTSFQLPASTKTDIFLPAAFKTQV